MKTLSLNSLPTIALSGIGAAQLRLASSAHNLANTQTAGFKRQLVAQQTVAESGVEAEVTQAEVQGGSLAEDLVEQKIAAVSIKANLQVFKSQDDMLGSLLDLRA